MDQTQNLELLEQEQEEQLFDLDVRIAELMEDAPDTPPTVICHTNPIRCR
ncbi:FDLD family class I lanthipeptide [Ktedonosporobacter rubrisoli]|nr:FDLD family class I lanthipeptide [Ktedonosporobacter rubrisoli]